MSRIKAFNLTGITQSGRCENPTPAAARRASQNHAMVAHHEISIHPCTITAGGPGISLCLLLRIFLGRSIADCIIRSRICVLLIHLRFNCLHAQHTYYTHLRPDTSLPWHHFFSASIARQLAHTQPPSSLLRILQSIIPRAQTSGVSVAANFTTVLRSIT